MCKLKHLYIIKIFLQLNRQPFNGSTKQLTAAALLYI